MVVGNGVHLHHLILEIFVQNSKDQKIDFMGTILHNQAGVPHLTTNRFGVNYETHEIYYTYRWTIQ